MMTLSFFGDFVCLEPAQVSCSEAFRNWAEADVLACNLEAPVKSDAEPAPKSGPSLSQSEDSPTLLRDLGINLVLLANNHIMDYGNGGLSKTLESLGDIASIGAGDASHAYDVTILEKNGIRVGLMSLVQHEFGVVESLDEGGVGTAWINHPIVPKKIKDARELCDVLIVLPHAGFENIDAPLPEWRDNYKSLIDLGADAVIASHPHVPQGWEDYNGKRIYYSLGNFCFDKKIGSNPFWNKSLSVKVTISDDHSISLEEKSIIFENGIIDIDESEEIKQHIGYLQKLLSTPAEYKEYIDEQLEAFWESYRLYMLRGLGAFSLNGTMNTLIHSAYGALKGMDIPMLLNNFQCETHSWAIQRILNNRLKRNKK